MKASDLWFRFLGWFGFGRRALMREAMNHVASISPTPLGRKALAEYLRIEANTAMVKYNFNSRCKGNQKLVAIFEPLFNEMVGELEA